MSFEGQQIYYTDQNLVNDPLQQDNDLADLEGIENKFMQFVRECQK